jgi:hypothetical protein
MADTRICEVDRIGQIKATCALFKPTLLRDRKASIGREVEAAPCLA